MVYRLKVPILIGLIMCVRVIVGAQSTDTSLVVRANDQLWTVGLDGTGFTQLTDDRLVNNFALSPNGQFVAYGVQAQITADAIAERGGFSGLQPTDMRMLNLTTGEVFEIAGQPDDAVFYQDDAEDNALSYSTANWSLDGEKFAWTTVRHPDYTLEFGMYDLQENTVTTQLLELPSAYGTIRPYSVIWGPGGLLAMLYPTFDADTRTDHLSVIILDDTGNVLRIVPLDPDGGFFFGNGMTMRWLSDTNPIEADLLYVGNYRDGVLVNAQTGVIRSYDGIIEMTHAAAPDGLTSYRDLSSEDSLWNIVIPGDDSVPATVFSVERMPILGPAGDVVILANEPEVGALTLWQDGATTHVTGTGQADDDLWVRGISWGPLNYRLVAGTESQAAYVCPGLPDPPLSVGFTGAVIDGSNNLRSEPSTRADVVALIPQEVDFTVIGGVVCAEGFRWWQVDYEGQVGWTADGLGGDVWVYSPG